MGEKHEHIDIEMVVQDLEECVYSADMMKVEDLFEGSGCSSFSKLFNSFTNISMAAAGRQNGTTIPSSPL